MDEEKETKSEKPAEETKSQRLLVVEDNEFNMEVIKTMLQKMGHSVTVAWNGSECLEQLFDSDGRVIPGPRPKRLCFDLIFMDCNMPVMDGYEAAAFIRKAEKRLELNPTPVIALTAYAMSGDRDKCLKSGMTDYLTKPMSKEVLVKMIARYTGTNTPTFTPSTPHVSTRAKRQSGAVSVRSRTTKRRRRRRRAATRRSRRPPTTTAPRRSSRARRRGRPAAQQRLDEVRGSTDVAEDAFNTKHSPEPAPLATRLEAPPPHHGVGRREQRRVGAAAAATAVTAAASRDWAPRSSSSSAR